MKLFKVELALARPRELRRWAQIRRFKMKPRLVASFLMLVLAFSSSALAQSPTDNDWRTIKPKTVTLFSRAKYKDASDGYDKSTFSFRYGVRIDVGGVARNNQELQYGQINWNGDSDWFTVTLANDDRSRIKDLGVLKWSDIGEVPLLPASSELEGFNMPSEGHQGSSNLARVVIGHLYVVHSKDSDSDFYALFRVENLVPSDQVTISWKLVPSPEHKPEALAPNKIVRPEPREATFAPSAIRLSCLVPPWPGQLL
jgi:hypothetical protein